MLVPIISADNTNFLFKHSNINILFKTVHNELIKIKQWFLADKLSLTVGKTKFLIVSVNQRKNATSPPTYQH